MRLPGLGGLSGIGKALVAQEIEKVAPGVGMMMGGPMDGGRSRRRSQASAPGNLSAIQRKMYKGFMDAGRPDLAKMVGTKSMDTWIGQESGWNPRSVGAGLGPDRRVGGLFQFMDFEDRDYLDNQFNFNVEGPNGYGRFRMPVREQARIAAEKFGLDPSDIRKYARSIRKGTYEGWG